MDYINLKNPKNPDDILVDIDALANYHSEREHQKLQTFNKILLQCSRKIEHEFKTNKATRCVFEIPEWISGAPRRKKKEVLTWLIKQLESKEYDVEPIDESSIYISWKRKMNTLLKKEPKKEEPPIILSEDTAMNRVSMRAQLIRKRHAA